MTAKKIKGSMTSPVTIIAGLIVAALLSSQGAAAFSETMGIVDKAVLEVSANRLADVVVLASSIEGQWRLDLDGYRVSYDRNSGDLTLHYSDELHKSRDISSVAKDTKIVVKENKKSEEFICVYSDDGRIAIAPDRCG